MEHGKSKFSLRLPSFGTQDVWVIGACILFGLVVVIHYPALLSGFSADDYVFVERAGRATNIVQYMLQSFDVRVTSALAIRRPIVGALFLIEYNLFHDNAAGYHFVNIALHAANSLLLAWLVFKVTRRLPLSLLSGLFYGALPVKAFCVIWISTITDVASGFFYLLAICFWLVFLQGKREFYFPTFLAAIAALLCKENVISLPITLFLFDRLVVRNRASALDLVRRYSPFAVVLVLYLILYSGDVRYIVLDNLSAAATQSIQNYAKYLTLIAFPWDTEFALDNLAIWGWAIGFWFLFVVLVWNTSDRRLLFLGLQTFVTLVAYLPLSLFYDTYLYLPAAISAILWGAFFARTFSGERLANGIRILMTAAILLLILHGGSVIADTAGNLRELSRLGRIPFRAISEKHPSFSPGTLLYFVDSPTPITHLSSMFFLRYGNAVQVGDIDLAATRRLREGAAAFVYYFEGRNPKEVVVSRSSAVAVRGLPFDFGDIGLQDVEITNSMIRRGDPLVLLLYWKANRMVSKDYTVFVHLLGENDTLLLGQDSPPGNGNKPTSGWKEARLVVDAHVLEIPQDTPVGKYRLAVGLYYLPTLERLMAVDSAGNTSTDGILIEPLAVTD